MDKVTILGNSRLFFPNNGNPFEVIIEYIGDNEVSMKIVPVYQDSSLESILPIFEQNGLTNATVEYGTFLLKDESGEHKFIVHEDCTLELVTNSNSEQIFDKFSNIFKELNLLVP